MKDSSDLAVTFLLWAVIALGVGCVIESLLVARLNVKVSELEQKLVDLE